MPVLFQQQCMLSNKLLSAVLSNNQVNNFPSSTDSNDIKFLRKYFKNLNFVKKYSRRVWVRLGHKKGADLEKPIVYANIFIIKYFVWPVTYFYLSIDFHNRLPYHSFLCKRCHTFNHNVKRSNYGSVFVS